MKSGPVTWCERHSCTFVLPGTSLARKGKPRRDWKQRLEPPSAFPSLEWKEKLVGFNTHKMAVLSQALAQTPLEQGAGLGGVFPLIPASDMALTRFMAL